MFDRLINLPTKHSFFLFGARGTGKTSLLLRKMQESSVYVNLLEPEIFNRYLMQPAELKAFVAALPPQIDEIIIDEIQKVPELLNVVHMLIEDSKREGRSLAFAMTGSSARKLKRGSANLLAGRAYVYHLHPLTYPELAEVFELQQALEWGTLPALWFGNESRSDYLKAYAQTYIKEEIWDEHVIRKLPPFSRFLEVAAQTNTQIVNLSRIARDVGCDAGTVKEYFQILEDTHLGFVIDSFHESIRKRQRSSPKFYFFDTGVKRALARELSIPLPPHSYAFGKAFEHFLILEILRLSRYRDCDYSFSYLRTQGGAEIDLLIDRPGLPRVLLEIKSSNHIREDDARTLNNFLADFRGAEAYIFSLDSLPKRFAGVTALPWQRGLQELGLVPSDKELAR